MLYILLIILLFIQIWAVFKQKNLSKKRLRIKLMLNLVAWVVLLLFIINPKFSKNIDAQQLLIYSSEVPQTEVSKIKDSLKIKESFSLVEFQNLASTNEKLIDNLGKITLLGNQFNNLIINQLITKNISWIPYHETKQIQRISWQGILRKNDIQSIEGDIFIEEKNILRAVYANKTLNSVELKKGFNHFQLQFPSFGIGKTEIDLELDNQPIQKVAFFSRKPQTTKILFILENPDFETKTLAEWLGKNGHQVQIQTQVAKDSRNAVYVNTTEKNNKNFEPQIIFTDASNAQNSIVKNALLNGKSVFFMNVLNTETEIRNINQAIGTKFQLKRISQEENIKINENLTALPYTFIEKEFQQTVGKYPIVIRKTSNKIGISLLNETFPLKLSGDSLNYSKIWSGILQQLSPSFENNVEIEAPVFQDVDNEILLNNFTKNPTKIKVENDTVSAENLVVNPSSYSTKYIFRKPDWQPLGDSLEVFVENADSRLARAKNLENFMQNRSNENFQTTNSQTQTISTQLPDWLWFLIIFMAFAALWIESKLNY